MPTTGRRLKATREYLGFTPEQVCRFARIERARFDRIERDQAVPDPRELTVLARLYQRPASWFTGGYVDPGPNFGCAILATLTPDLERPDIEELERFAEFLRLRKAHRARQGPSQSGQPSDSIGDRT